MTISSHRRDGGTPPASEEPRPAGADPSVTRPAPADAGGEPEADDSDWLGGELRRLYRTVASEPVPEQLLGLLDRLDTSARQQSDAGTGGGADEQPTDRDDGGKA
ncbi:MAG: NepR family anti-sigma factor [Azospirillaceae bacterium]